MLDTKQAAFVTRLRPRQLPVQVARQLPGPTDNFLGGSFLHWSTAPLGRTEKSRLNKGIRAPLTLKAKAEPDYRFYLL